MGELGVALMAYGTPARPEDVEAYYTYIRRGRTPSRQASAHNGSSAASRASRTTASTTPSTANMTTGARCRRATK